MGLSTLSITAFFPGYFLPFSLNSHADMGEVVVALVVDGLSKYVASGPDQLQERRLVTNPDARYTSDRSWCSLSFLFSFPFLLLVAFFFFFFPFISLGPLVAGPAVHLYSPSPKRAYFCSLTESTLAAGGECEFSLIVQEEDNQENHWPRIQHSDIVQTSFPSTS